MRGGEYKCRVSKMHLKLRDEQLKTSRYIHTLLYKNLMVTARQKSIIDIHTKRKKEAKPNTKDSHQITDIEIRLVVAKGEAGGGGKDWEFGISRCKLIKDG